jgi:hypothetical protein
MSEENPQDNDQQPAYEPPKEPRQLLQEFVASKPTNEVIEGEMRDAKAREEHACNKFDKIADEAKELANAQKRIAKDKANREILEAQHAQKVNDHALNGLYETTDPEDRTDDMKDAHKRIRKESRKAALKNMAIGTVFGSLVTATVAITKGPELQEGVQNWIGTTVSNESAPKKVAPFKSDGNYYIQIGQSSQTDPEQVLKGHEGCPNSNGKVSMIFEGKSFPTQADAVNVLSVAKKDYPKAWVTSTINCDRN